MSDGEALTARFFEAVGREVTSECEVCGALTPDKCYPGHVPVEAPAVPDYTQPGHLETVIGMVREQWPEMWMDLSITSTATVDLWVDCDTHRAGRESDGRSLEQEVTTAVMTAAIRAAGLEVPE